MSKIPRIDENDEVIGMTTIAEAKERGWSRRISRVFLFNLQKDKMLLQLRSKNVHSFPDLWDQAVGGHVDLGEEYIDAAVREMNEELGLSGISIEEIATSYKNGGKFEGIFRATISEDEDVQFDADEVAEIKWIDVELFEQDRFANPNAYVPPFIAAWEAFKSQLME